jgi:hypothetical protein
MSNTTKLNELKGLSNGLLKISKSFYELKAKECDHYMKAFVLRDLNSFKFNFENKLSDLVRKNPMENLDALNRKASVFAQQAKTILKSDLFTKSNPFMSKRSFHTNAKSYLYVYRNRNYQTKVSQQTIFKKHLFLSSSASINLKELNKNDTKKSMTQNNSNQSQITQKKSMPKVRNFMYYSF